LSWFAPLQKLKWLDGFYAIPFCISTAFPKTKATE
jgi:hypothetical protein